MTVHRHAPLLQVFRRESGSLSVPLSCLVRCGFHQAVELPQLVLKLPQSWIVHRTLQAGQELQAMLGRQLGDDSRQRLAHVRQQLTEPGRLERAVAQGHQVAGNQRCHTLPHLP